VRNVEALRADPGSILHLYRRLLAARKASPALHRGSIELLDSPPAVLAYRRSTAEDERTVLVNVGDAAVDVPGIAGVIDVASDGAGEGEPFGGRLAGDTAVIVRPA
jgi:alpha-glucosidase